jgi:hypothetical protein
MVKKKVEPISIDENGNMIINLAATQGSDDWIRAARLQNDGKEEEFKAMIDRPMYTDEEE